MISKFAIMYERRFAMKIVELTSNQFDEFARFHPLSNYCQSSKYAIVMSEYGYSYDYIGYVDDDNTIKAASLILTKKITAHTKYGYAPKGFLLNYYDQDMLRSFLNDIRRYYKQKDFIFVKFNPEIIIGETDEKRNFIVSYNGNVRIIDDLKTLNVKRRLELQEFDLMQPKFNAYINLKSYNYRNLERNYRKKIKNGENKGLSLVVGGPKDIEILYNMLKGKTKQPLSYYRNIYNIFSRDNSIDLVYIKIDYQKYLTYCREVYEKEQIVNDHWNEVIQSDPRRKNLNEKMNSDKKLQAYKNNVIKATDGLKRKNFDYIAGALVIKHFNRIVILASGFNDQFKFVSPNHFLYHSIFERYKPYFDYCDMNGVSGNFENTSPYYGLNQFKIKFKPTIYEFVGEFDLICSDRIFKKLIKTSFIEDEFNRH